MASEKSLAYSNTSMLLLQLLSEKDMYGYEMIEILQKRSNHVFELKAGTLYPLLHTLEAQNLVVSYETENAGKTRKYYKITKEGHKALTKKRQEWVSYSKAVNQMIGGVLYGAS